MNKTLYLHQSQKVSIILSFLIIALPLCLGMQFSPAFMKSARLDYIYILFLSNLHFTVTLGFFVERKSAFFAKKQTQIIFHAFALILILVFSLLGATNIQSNNEIHYWIFFALKLINVHHFGRQTLGVLQFFKESNIQSAGNYKKNESLAFYLLETLLLFRLIFKHFYYFYLLVIPFIVLFIVLSIRIFQKNFSKNFRLYYIFQSLSFLIVIAKPSLFVFAIAVHYFEYLLIISNRFFDKSSCFYNGGLKGTLSNPFIFFIAAMNISAWVTLSFIVDKSIFEFPIRFLISSFDGIFALHFLIESFAWRQQNV